jgi:hypothetical protein
VNTVLTFLARKMVVRIDTIRYLGVTPEERLYGTHRIGSIGSSAGLDILAKRKTTGRARKRETIYT